MPGINLENIIRGLGRKPFFRDLPTEELRPLFTAASYRDLRNHETLFRAGGPADSFAVVVHGALKLERPVSSDESIIMYFAVPGEIVGALFLAGGASHYAVSATALGPSAVLEVPADTFRRFWMAAPTVQSRLHSLFLQRVCHFQEQRTQIKVPLQGKIAALILDLLSRQSTEGKERRTIPLTRKEIADSLGASVESVIRNLGRMAAAGLIRTEGKTIEALRLEALIELSRGD